MRKEIPLEAKQLAVEDDKEAEMSIPYTEVDGEGGLGVGAGPGLEVTQHWRSLGPEQ